MTEPEQPAERAPVHVPNVWCDGGPACPGWVCTDLCDHAAGVYQCEQSDGPGRPA